MQPLALFDLDDTLVDRRAAFNARAEEFVTTHGLDDKALAFLIIGDAHHSGPMDDFFAVVCETFDLREPPERLWEQYRRRIPELASCRAADLDALRRLRQAGWRLGIVTNGMIDNQLGRSATLGWTHLSTRGASRLRSVSASLTPKSSGSPPVAAEPVPNTAAG